MRSRFLFLFIAFPIFVHTASGQCFDTKAWDDVSKIGSKDKDGHTMEEYCTAFIGCSMPTFSAVTVDGSKISNTILHGKVTVFYFWDLHNNLNVSEASYLNKLVDTFKTDNVRLIAICINDSAKWDKRSEKFFHFQHIARSKDMLSKFKGYPTIIIFDKNGKTVYYNIAWESKDHLNSTDRTPTFIEVIRKALRE